MTVRYLFTFLLTLLLGSVLALGQNSKQELNDQFWEAVRRGDAPAVTSLLDKGADVNAKFRYGTTALFKAAERGHVEIVKILLARGADVTVKDTFYQATAMTWALQNDHFDVVNELLEKEPAGAEDVLMTGVTGSKLELVKIALAKGGLKKEILTTALYLASRDKVGTQTLELLKNAGAVPPPEIKATTLESYAGKYEGAAQEITITFANGALAGFVTGQRPRGLMPIDETTFRALFVDDIVVRFKVDQGKVVGLTLLENQRN
ncbi:MAG TPA: ankyrin repeat domain-containing protein [Pyrinomonadaceae bacterium]|nr:ankyrin repeat domain-containing protein [Pyrinomonadaceae bacterium]